MGHLERIKKYAHRLFRAKLVWSMGVEANLLIFALATALFSMLLTKYPEFSYKLSSGFLLGIAIGLCIGLYWRRVMARNWGFYRKFYGEATGANARLRMAPKKLRLEWPTYLLSVVMGVVLFRMVVEGVSWLAGSIFFGFAAGSALGLVLILRELL
ncbi:MAG: hypothetical protein V1731_03480 [Candidatus Aenigmatarchaeota archaeon]